MMADLAGPFVHDGSGSFAWADADKSRVTLNATMNVEKLLTSNLLCRSNAGESPMPRTRKQSSEAALRGRDFGKLAERNWRNAVSFGQNPNCS
jgi:hypothetical protein